MVIFEIAKGLRTLSGQAACGKTREVRRSSKLESCWQQAAEALYSFRSGPTVAIRFPACFSALTPTQSASRQNAAAANRRKISGSGNNESLVIRRRRQALRSCPTDKDRAASLPQKCAVLFRLLVLVVVEFEREGEAHQTNHPSSNVLPTN